MGKSFVNKSPFCNTDVRCFYNIGVSVFIYLDIGGGPNVMRSCIWVESSHCGADITAKKQEFSVELHSESMCKRL